MIIPILAIALSLFSLLIASLALKVSKKTLKHNAILYLQKEYRSPEMLDALHQLWNLHDECVKKLELDKKKNGQKLTSTEEKNLIKELQDKYENIYRKEKQVIDKLTINKANERQLMKKEIFDNQRRIVYHFYDHLLTLVDKGILDPIDVRDLFKKPDTIKYICIPLDMKLIDIIYEHRPWVDKKAKKEETKRRFDRLYDIMKDC